MTAHIVMFSGGIGSWAAAKRVADRYGSRNLYLMFADTLIEDEDLYRFLTEAATNTGGRLIKVADGRTPWQVFKDTRYIGNTRIDPCSRILKRELLRWWLEEMFDPKTSIVYLGMDWTEIRRYEQAVPYWSPWTIEAPLCEPPLLNKDELQELLRTEGIEVPRLYKLGFPHNNCGGFCVKAGQAHFINLLEQLPERYHWHEQQEEDMRQFLSKDVAILRKRKDGVTYPLTLQNLRVSHELGEPYDPLDWGGCGCFGDSE